MITTECKLHFIWLKELIDLKYTREELWVEYFLILLFDKYPFIIG